MLLNFIVTVILSFYIASCAEINSHPDILNVVDIEKKQDVLIPAIDKNTFRPIIANDAQYRKRLPVVCLVFGPGLNRTFLYSSIIKAFEDESIDIHMMTGFGLGLVYAGLLASSQNSKKIEWNTYKYLEQEKNDVFSRDWQQGLEQYLYKNIKQKKIQNFTKSFFVPHFNMQTDSVTYLKKGYFGDIFRKYAFSNNYRVFPSNVYNVANLRKLGADIIIGIDLLGTSISFINASGFLVGQYGKALSMQLKHTDQFDHIIHVPVEKMPLDEFKKLDVFFQKSYEFTRNELKMVKDKITNWNRSDL